MTFDNRYAVVGVIVVALCTSQWLPQVFNDSFFPSLSFFSTHLYIPTCDDDERMSSE